MSNPTGACFVWAVSPTHSLAGEIAGLFLVYLFILSTQVCVHVTKITPRKHSPHLGLAFLEGLFPWILWHRQASSTCRTHHGATEQGCPHCPHLGARRARFILGSKYQKGMCPEVGSKLVFAQQRDKRKGQELMPRKLQLNLRRNFFPVQ